MLHQLWTGAVFVLLATAAAADDDPAELLKKKGLARAGSAFVLAGEATLAKELKNERALQKDLKDALKVKASFDARQKAADRELETLILRRRQLNAQLPRLAQIDVDQHNQAVATINQITNRLNELYEQKFTSKEARQTSEQLGKAREKFIQFVLDLRKVADETTKQYDSMKEDSAVQEAIEAAGTEDGKTYTLGPSRLFESNVRKLQTLEKTVRSEAITLRKEGNTFWVTVVFNGKGTKELVFDTGASSISLPAQLADDLGVEVTDADPTVLVTIADGSTVEAKSTRIESVRVGEFEVKNVECIVMPRRYSNAPPLLGNSFLNNFSFRLDTEQSKLTLLRAGDEPETKKRRTR